MSTVVLTHNGSGGAGLGLNLLSPKCPPPCAPVGKHRVSSPGICLDSDPLQLADLGQNTKPLCGSVPVSKMGGVATVVPCLSGSLRILNAIVHVPSLQEAYSRFLKNVCYYFL